MPHPPPRSWPPPSQSTSSPPPCTAPSRAARLRLYSLPRRVGAALLILLLGAASSSWAQTPGEPGTLVATELIRSYHADEIGALAAEVAGDAALPAAQTDAEAYLVQYTSSDRNGAPATITAQLLLPAEVSEPFVYMFGPGTTGLDNLCAPSRELTDGVNFSNYLTYGLTAAAQGVPVLIPNYLGLNDPDRLQPYFSVADEARVMLDGGRALRAFVAEARPDAAVESVFFGGYSQGGHASLAAADALAEYEPELPLGGVVGYGSSADLEALLRDWQVAAPYIVFVMSELFLGTVDPAEILLPYYADNLVEEVTRNCVDGIQRNFPRDPDALFQPAFAQALYEGDLSTAYPAFHEALEANKPGLSGHGVPVLINQGSNDTVVRLSSQDAYVEALYESGAAVRYTVYDDILHDTRWEAFADTLAWMRARAAGEDAPSDCATAP